MRNPSAPNCHSERSEESQAGLFSTSLFPLRWLPRGLSSYFASLSRTTRGGFAFLCHSERSAESHLRWFRAPLCHSERSEESHEGLFSTSLFCLRWLPRSLSSCFAALSRTTRGVFAPHCHSERSEESHLRWFRPPLCHSERSEESHEGLFSTPLFPLWYEPRSLSSCFAPLSRTTRGGFAPHCHSERSEESHLRWFRAPLCHSERSEESHEGLFSTSLFCLRWLLRNLSSCFAPLSRTTRGGFAFLCHSAFRQAQGKSEVPNLMRASSIHSCFPSTRGICRTKAGMESLRWFASH